MLRKTLLAITPVVALATAPMLHAADVPPAMTDYIHSDLKNWVNAPQIVAAIRAQNAETAGLTESEIIARDTTWRDEIGKPSRPTIEAVLNAPVSEFLREHLAKSDGRITEVFVMDSQGLNVGSSGVTSDYWQGDEAKFQETYPKGAGAVFVDEIELDESTQSYQGQVSFSITDPESGEVVGAITVGLNAEAFF